MVQLTKNHLYGLGLIATPIMALILICVGGTGSNPGIPVLARNITLIQSLDYVDQTNRFKAMDGNETVLIAMGGAQLTLESTAMVTVYTCNVGSVWVLGSAETNCGFYSNRSTFLVVTGLLLLVGEVVLALIYWKFGRRHGDEPANLCPCGPYPNGERYMVDGTVGSTYT